MKNEHLIIIEIGDWSGDGHGQKELYTFASNLPINDIREAYFSAKQKYPKLCPEGFCSDYGDPTVPKEVIEGASKLGFKIDPDDFFTEEMAKYTAWFCQLGNSKLELKIQKSNPTLAFYGKDTKGRHISFIGYGFLGN